MISFSQWIIHHHIEIDLQNFLRKSVILSFIVIVLEILFFDSIGLPKNFFGVNLPRFSGIVGESNYSAMFLALAGILLFTLKDYIYSLFSVLLIFPCVSRSAILTVVLFLVLHSIWRFASHNTRKVFTFCYFTLFTLTPGLVYTIHKFGSFQAKSFIENLSSGRFFLFVPYIEMGIKNPFGVGYFRGWKNYSLYQAPHLDIMKLIRTPQNNEQHNLIIQIFSEFGFVGYLIFVFFLINLFRKYELIGSKYFPALMAVFFGYSFLNGLNEFMLWLILGISLDKKVKKMHRTIASNNI